MVTCKRAATRRAGRSPLTSMMLLLSLLVVLSLLLLLRATHLLHNGHASLHGQSPSEGDPSFLDHLPSLSLSMDDDPSGLGQERARNVSGQNCVHPSLHPRDPAVLQFYRREAAVDCTSVMDDWVYVTNGTFRISRRARRLHGAITCECAPIVRVDDFTVRHAQHVRPMLDGTRLTSDFFKVGCVSASGRRYLNVHSGVAWNAAVHQRLRGFLERGAGDGGHRVVSQSPRASPSHSLLVNTSALTSGSEKGPVSSKFASGSEKGPVSSEFTSGSEKGDVLSKFTPGSEKGHVSSTFTSGSGKGDVLSYYIPASEQGLKPAPFALRPEPSSTSSAYTSISEKGSMPSKQTTVTGSISPSPVSAAYMSKHNSESREHASPSDTSSKSSTHTYPPSSTSSKSSTHTYPPSSTSSKSSTHTYPPSSTSSKSFTHTYPPSSTSSKSFTHTYPPSSTSSKSSPHTYPSSSTHTSESQQQQQPTPAPSHSLNNLSVFMFGFDSLSRMAWLRLLPRTRQYFVSELGGVEMRGYNVVGDGTPAALLPILTGRMEEELPETRRGFQGASTLDDHPWVWKDFSRHGYVTAHAEDMSKVGTFQLRMLGFKEQPTDHHMRAFYLAAEGAYRYNPPLCLGSTPRHVNFMNWFRELFSVYQPYPKFFFGFHSEMSHDYNNKVQALDDDLAAFLRDLHEAGHLNSTLLILMADHGARFDYIRATAQGKLEERMPYFSFRFPPWFRERYPEIAWNVEINSKRLTTPFDVHATFMDILNFSGSGVGDVAQRGISLFKEVPKERTCSHAGISPHWCACLEWQHVNQSDTLVARAVQSAIDAINRYTDDARSKCALVALWEITRSARYVPNTHDRSVEKKMMRYVHATHAERGDGTPPSSPVPVELYQVSFVTRPGHAHFEVTCARDVTSGVFSVSMTDVSRINRYGSQPACVTDTLPHLRPYCYCV